MRIGTSASARQGNCMNMKVQSALPFLYATLLLKLQSSSEGTYDNGLSKLEYAGFLSQPQVETAKGMTVPVAL